MKTNSLRELYIDQLQDLYSAEQQIIKALPKLIEAAQSEELKTALNEHLDVTREQATRIEEIFENLDEEIENEKCKGMEGVIKEGDELIKKVENNEVKDAAIIASAQRVEHYEMAGYGTARTYATLLGEDEAAEALQKTLDEEKEADTKLTALAEELNVEALEGEGSEQAEGEESEATERTTAKKKSAKSRRAA